MKLRSMTFRIAVSALAAGTVVGVLQTSQRLTEVSPVAATWSNTAYTSFDSAADWARGTHEGTRVSGDTLRFGSAIAHSNIGGARYERARWTSPWVTSPAAFNEIVPSWQATTPSGALVRFYLRARTASGTVSSYDDMGTWTTRDGEFKRRSAGSQTDDIANVATDTFRADRGSFTGYQLRVVTYRKAGTTGPTVQVAGAAATMVQASPGHASARLYSTGRTLNVPSYSQMIHRGEYPQYGNGGEAWCSPTSISMVMGYYKSLPPASNYSWVNSGYRDRWVDHAARMTYDHAYQGAGNWPFSTAYANQYVDNGFVTRLRNLRDAERFIRAGIPVIASISFSRGQLSGAPISSTNGHLLVISGFTNAGNVVVNDPAASSNAGVRRTYNRAQFEAAWLRKSKGLAYIVHDDAHPLPARAGATNW